MERLSLNDTVRWEEEEAACVLCDHADDAGSAMGYLKKLDTAQGGRETDKALAVLMVDSYEKFFYGPAIEQGMTPPQITEEMVTLHFTKHDINPLRQMRTDLNRLNAIQDTMDPRTMDGTGRLTCDDAAAKSWANFQRLKMDLIKQKDMCDRHTSRDMPSLT